MSELHHVDHDADASNGVVLFVDDEEPLLRAIERLMRGHGFVVRVASDSVAALTLMQSVPVDIIVSDFHLDPSMTGGGLLKLVADRFPDVARVLMSGSIDHDFMQELVCDGVAHHYLDKPWPPGELQRLLLTIAAARRSAVQSAGVFAR